MTPRQSHTLLPILLLSLLVGRPAGEKLEQPSEPADLSVRRTSLKRQKAALELELHLVQTDPVAYYLVVDLPAREVHLKSGAHLLRTCPVEDYRLAPGAKTGLLRMVNRIDPFTPEPGSDGLRLRGRALPLDFVGRLIEGPRRISRLYFSPSMLLQPADLPAPRNVGYLKLDGGDIKALGSALPPGSAAILIPPTQTPFDGRETR